MQLSWVGRRSEEIGGLESESLLSGDIKLAKLINNVGGLRLLLAVCRLLTIVSTLCLLLLLLKLAIPSKARCKELWRRAG